MLYTYFAILGLGLLSVTVFIILGSLASKKFNFSFSYLSIFSLALYFGISYVGTVLIHEIAGITLVGMVGLFEATIGLKLILKFGASIDDLTPDAQDLLEEDPHPSLVLLMVLAYMFIGWLGSLLA